LDVKKAVIYERLKLLNEYIGDLQQLQPVSFDTYQENKLIRRTVERTLHLAVEACLDIGQHLIAQEGYRTPRNNKEVFQILHEEGIFSADLLDRLMAMAGFRNLIVHDYAHIDDAAVFGILRNRLGDFTAFAQAVVAQSDTYGEEE
jgi:uncharacterized protein YutE (UPF0331/DUF86 family)